MKLSKVQLSIRSHRSLANKAFKTQQKFLGEKNFKQATKYFIKSHYHGSCANQIEKHHKFLNKNEKKEIFKYSSGVAKDQYYYEV